MSSLAKRRGNAAPDTPALGIENFAATDLFSGQSPNQDAKADAFRNRETSVPMLDSAHL
jgi:hypothetical protein